MADDEDLIPENVGQVLLKYPQIAPAMLYTARRQQYLGYDKSTDPMNDTWNGTRGDSHFCRGHHDHLIGTVCVAPDAAPEVVDWEVEESDVEAGSDVYADPVTDSEDDEVDEGDEDEDDEDEDMGLA